MQKSTVADSIYIFDNSPCDEGWMMKLQHLQTIQICHCHRMPGKYGKVASWHAAAFSGAHQSPGLGALVANLVPYQIDVRDGHICLQRLGQGLETERDQGWRLHPGLYRSNRDHWNPENTWHIMTFIWDILPDTKFERTIRKSTISFMIYHVDRFHSNIRFIVTKLNVGTWILGSSMRKVLAVEPS